MSTPHDYLFYSGNLAGNVDRHGPIHFTSMHDSDVPRRVWSVRIILGIFGSVQLGLGHTYISGGSWRKTRA